MKPILSALCRACCPCLHACLNGWHNERGRSRRADYHMFTHDTSRRLCATLCANDRNSVITECCCAGRSSTVMLQNNKDGGRYNKDWQRFGSGATTGLQCKRYALNADNIDTVKHSSHQRCQHQRCVAGVASCHTSLRLCQGSCKLLHNPAPRRWPLTRWLSLQPDARPRKV
jgi:hypothetical protein